MLILTTSSLVRFTTAQDVVHGDMVNSVMRALPEIKAQSLIDLKAMLERESTMAQHMRKFGRTGNRRGSFRFVQGFLGLTPHGKEMSQPAFFQAHTLEMIKNNFQLSNRDVRLLMDVLPSPFDPQHEPFIPDTPMPSTRPNVCPYPRDVACNPSAPYRTYDGTCNNLRHPMRGATHTPLSRFLPSQYGDAIQSPRVSVLGGTLPSARLVSSTIHWDIDIPHHIHTLMVMQYGQFLDHDLSRTAISKLSMDPLGRGQDLEEVECGFDGCQTSGLENQACLPIPVPRNDTEFLRQPCLMFVRSLEVPNLDCSFGPREQLNQLTSHLDASHIYGSSLSDVEDLMDQSQTGRGRLRMKTHPLGGAHADLLPQDPNFKDCKGDNTTFICFKAGDGRVNEFMGLTTQHTIWAREHNRIEAILHQLNPHWSSPRLFEETRRIMTAMWQWITYNEYLPVILGPSIMRHYGLNTAPTGHWNGYRESINPSVSNVFATAAMRFGHTQIQGIMEGKDVDYATREFIPISTQFRRPQLMYRPGVGGCDALLRGLVSTSAQSPDPFITKQVSRHLFADEPPTGLGEDLMSLNMQRAREHGIPGYNFWREWCGLSRARTFDDLRNDLPFAVVVRFKRLYRHPDDIDLWPAAIAEIAYPGSSLGPVFSCILATQFRNLKFGDRYWFENNQHNPHPFNTAQIQSLKRVRLSKLFCHNSDSIANIQPYVMVHPLSKVQQNVRDQGRDPNLAEFSQFYQTMNNERTSCDSLPDLDLRPWQEQAAPSRPNNFIPQTGFNGLQQNQRPSFRPQQHAQRPQQQQQRPPSHQQQQRSPPQQHQFVTQQQQQTVFRPPPIPRQPNRPHQSPQPSTPNRFPPQHFHQQRFITNRNSFTSRLRT